ERPPVFGSSDAPICLHIEVPGAGSPDCRGGAPYCCGPVGPGAEEGAVAQRNRERLAAAAARRRANRRAYAGQAGVGSAGRRVHGEPNPGAGRARPSAETISTVLLSAAREHWAGDPEAATSIGVIVADRCADQPAIVAAGVQCAMLPLIAAAWERGWSPE